MAKKICFVITRLSGGGAQGVLVNLARGLTAREHDISVVYGPDSDADETYRSELGKEDLELMEVPQLCREVAPWRDLVTLCRLVCLFRRGDFDVVHTHTSKAGFLGTLAAKIAGIPRIIYTPHGHIFARSAQIPNVSDSPMWLLFFILRWLAEQCADRVVALTEHDKWEQVRLHLAPAHKYAVVHDGINTERFARADPAETESALKELGADRFDPLIGSVGRLSPEKGFQDLIEAMGQVMRREPDAGLLLVGEGPLRSELEQKAKTEGLQDRVVFAGHREDIPELLSGMDVFVLPSHYEALGLVLIEAMAAGIPVVATRVGGVPGVLRDGKEGLLVPSHDPKAMSETILSVAVDEKLAAKLADNARRRADRLFTVDHMIREYEKLYGQQREKEPEHPGSPRILVLMPAVHFHAPIVLRELCKAFPGAEWKVMLTPKLGKGKTSTLRRVVERSGFDFLASMVFTQFSFESLRCLEALRRVPFENRRYLSAREVVDHLALDAVSIEDCHSPKALQITREFHPDFIVLNLFNQIAGEKLISQAKRAAVNLHTSHLPSYRGVAPCFWTLANGEEFCGATVHEVTSDIDAGRILAREKVKIQPEDTFFSLYRRCSVVGARLLEKTIQNGGVSTVASDCEHPEESYFSFVTKKAVRKFRERGRDFFRLSCLGERDDILKAQPDG
ncbi:MAG: glycosyltransferase [Candidatus Brocadiia bacterium]